LDCGQASDPAAWVLNERRVYGIRQEGQVDTYSQMHATAYSRFPLRTPYTAIVRRLEAICSTPDLFYQVSIVIDCTRERAVFDVMKESKGLKGIPVIPIVITGGQSKHSKQDEYGWYTVPEVEFVSGLTWALESGRQLLSKGGGQEESDAEVLDEQLTKIRQKVSARRGSVSMSVDGTGVENDDMVFALASTVWYARLTGLFGGLLPEVSQGAIIEMDSRFGKVRRQA